MTGGTWVDVVYNSNFIANHWYVCVSKLANEISHVEILRCVTDGQMDISAISGQSVLGTSGFAILID
jgi:hypothetical protein